MDYEESLRKIVKGAGLSLIGTAIGIAFGYLSRLVVARFLDPSDYGLVSLGFGVFTIAATLSLLGLPQGVIRFVSFYKGKGDDKKIKGVIISALRIGIPSSSITSLIIFLGAEWISVNFFHEPNLTPILQIFALAIPFWMLAQIAIAVTIGFQDMRYDVYITYIFQNVFRLTAILILLWLGYGVIGASIGWVIAIAGMPFLSFYFLEKKVFPLTKVKAEPLDKELFTFSYPLILAGIAGLIMGWTDTVMLGYFLGAKAVGVYNVALPTARLIRMPLSSFGIIFFPVISELYARNEHDDLRRLYSVVTKWTLTITFPASLLLIIFSESVIRIMFGSEYVKGAQALSILALSFLIISTIGLSGSVLHAFGKTKVIMNCTFIGATSNVILNIFLIPLCGISGAAMATAISLIVTQILLFLNAHKIGRVQPFHTTLLKPVFASLIAVAVVYGIARSIGTSLISFILLFPIFTGLYLFLLLIFRSFEEEDLAVMRFIDQKMGTKSDFLRDLIKKFL